MSDGRRNQHMTPISFLFNHPRRVQSRRLARAVIGAAGVVGGLGILGGCEVDSYLDPSVNGYWEHTPTTVPILEHVAAIDDVPRDEIETSEPTREDLLADAQAYRIGPSDEIEVQIDNFTQSSRTDVIPAQVDQRGYINFPKIGSINVLSKTDAEVTAIIERAIREKEILANPKVLVTVKAQRQQTFSATGGVAQPGGYFIPKPDYRLLEALTAAGGVSETAQKIYVIRQVALSDEAKGLPTAPVESEPPKNAPETAPPIKKEDVGELMKAILNEPAKKNDKPGSPGAIGNGVSASGVRRQPAGDPPATPPSPEKKKSDIDLIDTTLPAQPANPPAQNGGTGSEPATAATPPTARSKTKWVFINGQWTKQATAAPRATPSAPSIDPLAKQNVAADVMTQRVIEVPAQRLLAGHADVNIVIRPGDVIRVPVPDQGLFYVEGAVNNPGVYSIPPSGRITITQAIVSASGLAGQAIPERVDLTRRIARDREATIRLNLRAISEKTQPNIFLKPDDVINVGTNFWAFPLAVFRQGLRASYGFGFLLDRNFQGEVFGQDRSLSGN